MYDLRELENILTLSQLKCNLRDPHTSQVHNTVIPRFTRLLWQPKNRVNRKSRYTSHSIEEKIVKKISITLTFYTIKCPYTNLFRQGQKTA